MATELVIKSFTITPNYNTSVYIFNYYESGAPSNPTKIDVYPIQVSTSGYYKIQSNSDYDVVGYLFNSSNTQLIMNDNHPASDRNFELVYYFQSGQTYYLGAKPYSYTNTAASSIPIKFLQCFQFTVSAGTGGSATIDGQSSRWLYTQEYGYCQAIISSGYAFDDWYEDDIEQNYSSNVTTYLSGQDRHLEARFIKNTYTHTYTITFNANGGSGSVPSTITKTGTSASEVVMGDISNTIPTRTGYIFRGWSSTTSYNQNYRIAYSSNYGGSADSNGTTATTTQSTWTYQDYCDKTGASSASITLTLYAQWEIDTKTYTIQFDANGGSDSVPSTITKTGTSTATVMGDITSTVPTRTGYIFRGWSSTTSYNQNYRIAYNTASGGGSDSNGVSATITSSSWTYQDYCDNTGASSTSTTLTLYAQWENNTYTITYDANGGSVSTTTQTVTVGSSTTTPAATRSNGTSSRTVYFKANGGTTTKSSQTSTATVTYTSDGWYTDEGTYRTSNGGSYTPTQSETLYAQWDSSTGTYSAITFPSTEECYRDGYTLLGFSSSSTVTTATYAPKASPIVSGTWYAIWEKPITLTYDANGGSGTLPENQNATIYNATTSASFTVDPNSQVSLNRTGYTFLGWSTSPKATAASYIQGDSITISDNTTLYAVWKINQYTITPKVYLIEFDGSITEIEDFSCGEILYEDGTQFSSVISKDYGSSFIIQAKAKEGYTFKKWENNTALSYREIVVSNNNLIVEAYFTQKEYSLTIKHSEETPESDVKIWIRERQTDGTYDSWTLMDYDFEYGFNSMTFIQTIFEHGENYELDMERLITAGQVGVTFYEDYLIKDSITFTVYSKKRESKNSIWVGNNLKNSGYIKDPNVTFEEPIKSIWVGNQQVMGKAPIEIYPYKEDTILGNTLYIGYQTSNISAYQSFFDYNNLETVIFPPYEIAQQYFTIGIRAFFGNKNLSKINLNNSVKQIDGASFMNCSNLKKIFIPKSILYLDSNPFRYDSGIQKFQVDKDNLYYSTDYQGVLYNKEKTIIHGYPHQKQSNIYIFPKSVIEIDNGAFSRSGNLKYIYYEGTEEEWNNIVVHEFNNDGLAKITKIFNYKEEN